MRSSRRPWIGILAMALVSIGMAMFFINAEAVVNGDAVECDGSPMSPGQWCMRTRDSGVGVGTLGIVLFLAARRGNR
ncbi:hypothetical protein ACQEV2_36990 [Streptomyces sp. CA-251387]|uniref:hypothetical protein n=1 Tax=Streptomyces sp. CA-251387 TaxID=3240064 RepID=UPI003D8C0CFA